MKRSKFNLSHHKNLTADMGKLVPIGITEALPGDTFQHSTSMLVRTAPLTAPVMHPVEARIHHFFVPYRLIWKDFEDFITGGDDGNDASVFPTINLNTTSGAESSLADYLGVPTVNSGTLEVSALPFRAYNLIFNEFYRDQDLKNELNISTDSGTDTTTDTTLQKIAWEKDYFTSSRPWTQKGSDVTIPLGTKANVNYDGIENSSANNTVPTVFSTSTNQHRTLGGGVSNVYTKNVSGTSANNLYADLSSATGIDVNDLRLALALQRFKEARAQWGNRYTEYLKYLGVNAQDSRLQRPEYLGGGKQTIQFSEVLQTSEGTDPVGDMKGHGISALRSNKYQRFVPEHGIIMSFMSVRPKTMYMQSLPRHWNRRTKEEFFQRELQLIGQQNVKNKEIFAFHSNPDDTFGYQDRYDEYRQNESTISGEFRSSLNNWHMARDFSSDPALNETFVDCTPTDRIYASTATQPLWIMVNHHMVARRMLVKNPTNRIL
jgi:hypothetical protein